MLGLTRAFLYAGASALAESLWKVANASTARLMYGFYRAVLDGRSLPASLRDTQLAAIASTDPHPFQWALFVLVSVPAGGR
jgi:CHAT domain-containing protein